ncbi:MAG: ChbG/HpnK family deacetylase [Candidatus Moraniibacteriota bacterium]
MTADDYGIRQTAEPILRLVHEGKIDRVAVLIHYVSADQAAALLKTGVWIDLHLELIDILKSGDKMYDNVLKRSINFVFRYGCGLVTKKRVKKEWEAQVKRFHELFGRLPDGLNSHEHLHYFPPFFKICVRLAEAYDIPFVRFGKKGQLAHLHHSLTGKILSFFWKRTRSFFARTDRMTTDYHVSLDWFNDFRAFCQYLPSGSIELVVHPEREEDYRAILEYL